MSFQDFDVVPLYPEDLVERMSAGLMTATDADTVADGIAEVADLSRSENIQRVVVDTVSRVQVDKMFRTMDAAQTVGACALVKPTGQPIPSLINMIVMEPSITLPTNPMTSASDAAGVTYSGDSWEALVVVDKYVPSLLQEAEAGTLQLDSRGETDKCVEAWKSAWHTRHMEMMARQLDMQHMKATSTPS